MERRAKTKKTLIGKVVVTWKCALWKEVQDEEFMFGIDVGNYGIVIGRIFDRYNDDCVKEEQKREIVSIGELKLMEYEYESFEICRRKVMKYIRKEQDNGYGARDAKAYGDAIGIAFAKFMLADTPAQYIGRLAKLKEALNRVRMEEIWPYKDTIMQYTPTKYEVKIAFEAKDEARRNNE